MTKIIFSPVYSNDILNAAKDIIIISPFVTKRRVEQMLQYLGAAVSKQVTVTIMTRPAKNFKDKDQSTLQAIFGIVKSAGINVAFKSNIHQKFAVIDQRLAWYGSINLLSYGDGEESIMRIESANIQVNW